MSEQLGTQQQAALNELCSPASPIARAAPIPGNLEQTENPEFCVVKETSGLFADSLPCNDFN